MRYLLTLAILVGTLVVALAVTGTAAGDVDLQGDRRPGAIFGTVRAQDGSPIPVARVDCPGAGAAATAGNGVYAISDVPPGMYSCTASKEGFRSRTKPVDVDAGQTSKRNFRLRMS